MSKVVQHAAQLKARDLTGFNFRAPAELFPSRNTKGRSQVRYRRFATAAEALKILEKIVMG